MKTSKPLIFALIFMVAIILPYVVGFSRGNDLYVFNGFLGNPIDGHTYLAKMEIGERGDWQFHLPYSIERGGGALLFLFYIFLGHVAKMANIEPIFIFHGARTAGALILILLVYKLVRRISVESGISTNRAFFFSLFISGLGWLFVGMGVITSDLWVAEAYAFLSAYTNPHFPIGISLMLGIFLKLTDDQFFGLFLLAILNLLLAIILPFGVVIVVLVSVFWGLFRFFETRKVVWKQALAFIPGGVFILYQYWVTLSDPVLSAWNQQNQTAAPSILDLFISFSPLLLLAIPGAWQVFRRKERGLIRIMAFWFMIGFVLIFVPLNIQRRFSTGIMIPIVLLSEFAIKNLHFRFPAFKKIAYGAGYTTLPTLAIVIFLGMAGIGTYEPVYYFQASERNGLEWIKRTTPEDAIVLTSPESGLFIPAYTGRRVLYGHPYETIKAEVRKNQVLRFFAGKNTLDELESELSGQKINYIFWGPRERSIGTPDLSGFVSVFKFNDVEIFKTH